MIITFNHKTSFAGKSISPLGSMHKFQTAMCLFGSRHRFWRGIPSKRTRSWVTLAAWQRSTLWTVSERVWLELRDGKLEGAIDAAQPLYEMDWVVFLRSLKGDFSSLRHGI